MIKKIIIGIIITAVLSLGAAGSIYAYQKEQSKLNTATLTANDKNDGSVSSAENEYQYGNAYGKTEKNGNCESENNCYSWEHNYRYQNSNVKDESSTFRNQNRTRNENNECKNIKNNGR